MGPVRGAAYCSMRILFTITEKIIPKAMTLHINYKKVSYNKYVDSKFILKLK